MDIRQLTSPQGEADGVSDGDMTLQALGGVNSPCDWYRVRGQPLTTGGQEHTHTHTHTLTSMHNLSTIGYLVNMVTMVPPPPHLKSCQT
jgi:hypothetical protein